MHFSVINFWTGSGSCDNVAYIHNKHVCSRYLIQEKVSEQLIRGMFLNHINRKVIYLISKTIFNLIIYFEYMYFYLNIFS